MRAHATLALLLPVLLAGCSEQTLWGKIIVEDSGGDGEDGGGDGAAGDGGAADGGAADGGADSGTSAACPLPVPDQVAISRPVWGESGVHFYVPRPSWALASAWVWARSADLADEGITLRIRPSWLWATGLKESFLGCSDTALPDPVTGAAFARQAAADADGCLQIEPTTAWIELCRMYPDALDCERIDHSDVISSAQQATTGRDNVETSMRAAGLFGVFTWAMLDNAGADDPDAWVAAAADPRATEKLLALAFNRGLWSPELSAVISGCADAPLEDCVTPDSVAQDYVQAVGGAVADMEAALAADSCYDQPLRPADIDELVDALSPMLQAEDWEAARAAAQAAATATLDGRDAAPFQELAPPVIAALNGALRLRMDCPGDALAAWYGQDCPP
jgi:hypothetical protein